jgi:hypothetical protein
MSGAYSGGSSTAEECTQFRGCRGRGAGGGYLLYPESGSDDQMPAGCLEAGYRKEVTEDYRMTRQPKEDASTTRVMCRVSVAIWPIEQSG